MGKYINLIPTYIKIYTNICKLYKIYTKYQAAAPRLGAGPGDADGWTAPGAVIWELHADCNLSPGKAQPRLSTLHLELITGGMESKGGWNLCTRYIQSIYNIYKMAA